MRTMILAAAFGLAVPAGLSAQTAPAPAAAPSPAAPVATGYSTAATDLGTLLDNPQTKAVLTKHLPDLVANEQISMARQMTLRSVQQYAADMITDAKLAAVDADLAKIAVK